ncbi:MAG: hypothetical protein IPO88_30325 [Nannocystis sp.]|uniref:SIR2 family protein n=1 Tax=Nannocystis sp. TaxID=1962667 RepID=UPI002426C2F7|nr:SIR2 family protein [Nannocystis sp.]MBK9757729.1 hypothetical protein [Nannocystis sp.]
MAHDFASEEDLLDRLTAQPHDLVFLVGSAVTAPGRSGEPGVPRVDGVIDQIRRVYTRPDALERFEKALAAEPQQRYQAAFRHLQRTRGQDLANAIIRRCVLQARVPSRQFPQVHSDIAEGAADLCRGLEHDVEGWHLPPAVKALGRLLAGTPAAARPIVLTSNFDPLVTVSVHRAGGRAFTTALHSDGGFAAIDGQGTLVVHFHGDWFRSDTLHTPAQLGQDRPRLAASLAQLLGARTLVVLGYGGWDDIFTRSLIQVIRGELAAVDVLWAFYGADEGALQRDNAGLLANLAPGIDRARVMLYKGIDAHAFLPRLADAIGSTVLAPLPVVPVVRVVRGGACSDAGRGRQSYGGAGRGDAGARGGGGQHPRGGGGGGQRGAAAGTWPFGQHAVGRAEESVSEGGGAAAGIADVRAAGRRRGAGGRARGESADRAARGVLDREVEPAAAQRSLLDAGVGGGALPARSDGHAHRRRELVLRRVLRGDRRLLWRDLPGLARDLDGDRAAAAAADARRIQRADARGGPALRAGVASARDPARRSAAGGGDGARRLRGGAGELSAQ